jgi:small subunit ribosomal protein S2
LPDSRVRLRAADVQTEAEELMEIGLRELLEAGVHFGHQTRRWNPKMKRYIFMERNGIYIIDLQKTMHALAAARQAIDTAVRGGGKVLFVGTKRQAKEPLIQEAERSGMFHITERWLGGMLTNFKTVRSSVKRLLEIEAMSTDGTYERLAKKEVSKLEKQRMRLDNVFSGIKYMETVPSLVFIVDTKHERIAVNEANRIGVPIVGVVDTNCDPDLIRFPIPGNDDALRAIELYAKFVSNTILSAKSEMSEGESAGVGGGEVQAPPPVAIPEPATAAPGAEI